MNQTVSAELPLQIDRVHGSRPAAGEIRLALSGRWRAEPPAGAQEPLLVIQLEGRRHRFAAERAQAEPSPDGAWSATFAIPDWAEPRHQGQAAVWVGRHIIPLPALGSGPRAAPPVLGAAVPVAPGPDAATARRSELPAPSADADQSPSAQRSRARPEVSRSGPLADLLLKDTVAALHEEVGQRTAEGARLRGALADAQAELEGRAATQAQLEATLAELSAELRRLMAAVEEQREDLEKRDAAAEQERAELERRLSELTVAQERHAAELAEAADRHAWELAGMRHELAAAQVSRDAALAEAAGLRAELGRVGAELASSREKASSESGDLAEANRLLADAKALASRLRGEAPAG